MVELLMLLLISSLIIAALTPIVTRKHLKNPITAKHGTYMCYYKTNNTPGANQGKVMLYEKQLSGAINPSTVKEGQVSQCVFNPPKKASYFQITAIGGGGGGSDAGYTGGAPRTETIEQTPSPFNLTVENLDALGMRDLNTEGRTIEQCYANPGSCFSEFLANAGSVYAYARGFRSGHGGSIGYMDQVGTGMSEAYNMIADLDNPNMGWRSLAAGESVTPLEDGTYSVTYHPVVLDRVDVATEECCKGEWVKDESNCTQAAPYEEEYCTVPLVDCASAQNAVDVDALAAGAVSQKSTTKCCPPGRTATRTHTPDPVCGVKCTNMGTCPTGGYDPIWKKGSLDTVPFSASNVSKSGNTYYIYVPYSYPLVPRYGTEWYDLEHYTNSNYGSGQDGGSCATSSINGNLMLQYSATSKYFDSKSNVENFYNNRNGEDKDYNSDFFGKIKTSFADYYKTRYREIYAEDGKVLCEGTGLTTLECGRGDSAATSQVEISKCNNANCNSRTTRYTITATSASKAGTGAGRRGLSWGNVPKSPQVAKSTEFYDYIVSNKGSGTRGSCTGNMNSSNRICGPSDDESDPDYYRGYCLKHWNNSTPELNGTYKHKRTYDKNYLATGFSGDPGEFVTVVIRSLANVDRTIHIGRGGSGAQLNSGADGSKGSATYMGATPNSALVYAKGGDGGHGRDPEFLQPLPRFDRTAYNSDNTIYTRQLLPAEGKSPSAKSTGGMFNFVLSAFSNDEVLRKIIGNAGKGGRGGGVEHRCWAGQDIIEFEGHTFSTSVYPHNDTSHANRVLCDPEDFSNLAAGPGSDGALIIRW